MINQHTTLYHLNYNEFQFQLSDLQTAKQYVNLPEQQVGKDNTISTFWKPSLMLDQPPEQQLGYVLKMTRNTSFDEKKMDTHAKKVTNALSEFLESQEVYGFDLGKEGIVSKNEVFSFSCKYFCTVVDGYENLQQEQRQKLWRQWETKIQVKQLLEAIVEIVPSHRLNLAILLISSFFVDFKKSGIDSLDELGVQQRIQSTYMSSACRLRSKLEMWGYSSREQLNQKNAQKLAIDLMKCLYLAFNGIYYAQHNLQPESTQFQ